MHAELPTMFLAGPPFGRAMWREVLPRVPGAMAVDLLTESDPGGLAKVADRLAAMSEWKNAVVVAHGTAVPVAIAAAQCVAPRVLLLSNGPVRALDPVSTFVAHAVGKGGPLLLPPIWLRLLASSIALRRVVANPYAMDRDTVVSLCGPLVASAALRRRARDYYASLLEPLPDPRRVACPLGLIWGDADPLNPASEADWVEASTVGCRRVDLPGGRWMHPEERPWAFADAVLALSSALGSPDASRHGSHA